MTEKNIFQRMAAITAELQTVAKNLNVETGKGKSYKAVSERDIIDAVKPLESKHGVYSYPAMRETTGCEMLESENQYGKKTTFYSRIKTVYRFVNIDDPADYIDTEVFSVGLDTQDKGDGKAMTYGDKYALMKAYKISTGDDPDDPNVTAPTEDNYKKAKKPKSEPALLCTMCGNEIKDGKAKDGSDWPAEKIAIWSERRYRRQLCLDCAAIEEKRMREAGEL